MYHRSMLRSGFSREHQEAVAAAVATKAARVAALPWSTATPAILVPVTPTVSMSHGEKPEKFTAQISRGGNRVCCST